MFHDEADPQDGAQNMESDPEDFQIISEPPLPKGILKKTASSPPHQDVERPNKAITFRDVIADYLEPVPVTAVNEEEYANVLESYRELCDKLRVRPCQKLTDQLEGLQDSTLKLDTIDLKGARLDAAHCEALEAVLRVLRAQTLNIEQTQLDDDGAISVFEMIEYYEPVTRLIVANNVRLGVRAWLALARLLKRFHRLEYLDVRRTSLDESTMPLLCRVLKLNCTLRVLHLEDNHLSGILTRNLVWGLRTNTLLQDLYLGHNKLVPEDAKLLGSLLITNRTIRLLDLRNNRLQDTGILFLSSALEEQQNGLQLITVWSNQITSNSMSALGRALAFHSTLEGVNLGSNSLGNKGVELLKEGLLSSRSIARLVMASCNITNEGAVVMAEILGDHTTLIHLDLRENNISLAGVMALKCAYAINHRLLRLHLDVMKRANNDDLMRGLLGEIENYSLRNMEHHKNGETEHPGVVTILNHATQGQPEHIHAIKTPEDKRTLQERIDYELALKLQQEERRHAAKVAVRPLEKRPLPIISPTPSSPPDPTKTFGFFSGHYIKLKQRWDESLALYLNRNDMSLAASPGTVEIYPKESPSSTDEEDDNFVDAVEDHIGLHKAGPTSSSQDYTPPPAPSTLIHIMDSELELAPETAPMMTSPNVTSSHHVTSSAEMSDDVFSEFDKVWFGASESETSYSPATESYALRFSTDVDVTSSENNVTSLENNVTSSENDVTSSENDVTSPSCDAPYPSVSFSSSGSEMSQNVLA